MTTTRTSADYLRAARELRAKASGRSAYDMSAMIDEAERLERLAASLDRKAALAPMLSRPADHVAAGAMPLTDDEKAVRRAIAKRMTEESSQ